jgi:hypothetical protein
MTECFINNIIKMRDIIRPIAVYIALLESEAVYV